jgi:hypothetical protein
MATNPQTWQRGSRWRTGAVPARPRVFRSQATTRRIMEQEFDFPARGDYHLDRIFLDYLSPTHDVGWKLHVVKPQTLSVDDPGLPKNYLNLLRVLYVKKIPHKLVRNLAGIALMERNPTQRGKFITIYPIDNDQLKRVPELIEAPTNPIATGDLPVGARGLTTARWGGLTSQYAVDRDNQLIDDDRNAGPKPDWVKNPFNPGSEGAEGWVKFADNPDLQHEILRRRRAARAKNSPYGNLG